MRSRSMLPIIGALAFAMACDDSTHLGDAFAPNAHSAGAVVLEQSQYTGQPGDTARIRAFVLDVKGRRFTVEDLNWNSADSSIAVVNDGRLYLVQPGETQLSVDYNGTKLTASARASNNVKISGIDVFPEALNLAVDEAKQLGLFIRYSDGRSIENNLGVNWSSADPSVATVSRTGEVTAVKTGKARIIGKRGNRADTAMVTVVASEDKKPAPTLSIAPDTGLVEVGQSFRFSTALSTGEQSPEGVTWTISDPTVASISPTGELVGRKEGRVTVQAVYAGKGVKAILRVVPAPEPPAEEKAEETPPPDSDSSAPAPSEPAPNEPPPAPVAPGKSIARAPELPRVFLDTRMPAVTGRTIVAADSRALQQAIDDARPGDEIVLNAGTTYTGPFTLRKKSGSGWITIRSSKLGSLPAEGNRVGPANAGSMPKLITAGANAPVIRVEKGAGYYRLSGLEITAPTSVSGINALIYLHVDRPASVADLAHNIVIDRSYVHGHRTMQLTRCVLMNAASSAVIDSHLSDCHAEGFDSQAIVAWQTPGPLKIVNNYLEAAGENIMFGGAPAGLQGVMPSDIEIRRNHFFKPLSWRTDAKWSVKNLLEIKFGQRVLLEGNVFENNWRGSQTGSAILIKANDQDSSPWVRTQDVTVRYNIIKNSPGGFNIAALEHVPTARVRVEHNIIVQMGVKELGTLGRIAQLLGAIQDIAFENNTMLYTTGDRAANAAFALDGSGAERISILNNVVELGPYGVKASGGSSGTDSMEKFASSWAFSGNVMIGSVRAGTYPDGNSVVSSVGALGFINPSADDYRLSSSSYLRTGGSQAGADAEAVNRAVQGVVRR